MQKQHWSFITFDHTTLLSWIISHQATLNCQFSLKTTSGWCKLLSVWTHLQMFPYVLHFPKYCHRCKQVHIHNHTVYCWLSFSEKKMFCCSHAVSNVQCTTTHVHQQMPNKNSEKKMTTVKRKSLKQEIIWYLTCKNGHTAITVDMSPSRQSKSVQVLITKILC